MKRRLYAPAVLLIGLLSAQVVATVHVYLSNHDLLQSTESLIHAGYLAIPNAWVAERLPTLTIAMAGGLFFTLSIGAGLSLATLIAVWIWDRICQRSLPATVSCLIIWLLVLVTINGNGWNLAASTYCLAVPLITAVTAIRLLPHRTPLLSPARVFWPVSAAIVLALLWGLVMDRHLFANIRDHLLLSNRAGQSLTAAYYELTLYPAEAFKALNQKQIRTCVLDDSLDRAQRSRLDTILRAHDYLPLPSGNPADLTISYDHREKRLLLNDRHHPIIRIFEDDLLANPSATLALYSQKLDDDRMFRRLTLACLLLGFPLVLFTLGFCFIGWLPNLFLTINQSNIIAAAACLLAGAILLVPVYQGHSAATNTANPATALASAAVNMRVAALRQAYDNRHDIAAEARQYAIEKSPHIAERYWLARSLAYAQHADAQAILLTLADDPSAIVACQALWALGQRQNRDAIPAIIARIQSSSHWYIQMYGYRAARTLGWVQPRSPQLSY